jgi:tetratricopeptide (TPR) repeat protein
MARDTIDSEECRALDERIRQGRIGEVRLRLKELNLVQIPRSLALSVANVARRVGLFHLSIRILAPVIHNEKTLEKTATAKERSEYAMNLINLGALVEARRMLMQIDSAQEPQALMFLAFSYPPEWDYQAAATHLRRFLEAPNTDVYQRSVAEVNLCAALLHEGIFDEAEERILRCIEFTRENKLNLLNGNLHEIHAQLAIAKKDFVSARQSLEESSRLLGHTGVNYELFVQKWQSLVDLYEIPSDTAALGKLREVQLLAQKLGHWETLRDLDQHLALLANDESLYHTLYHGTPFSLYRRKIRARFSDAGFGEPPDHYSWYLGAKKPNGTPIQFEVAKAHLNGLKTSFKPGQHLHSTLRILASDFYRPVRIGSLINRLFPDESYDPNTSPNRIHQFILRIRAWAEEENLPLIIEEAKAAYRLTSPGGLMFQVSLPPDAPTELASAKQLSLSVLKVEFPSSPFSAKEAAQTLGVSVSSVTRLLREALATGELQKQGASSATVYSFVIKKSAA